jgi:REP-associated tyrosine transposase
MYTYSYRRTLPHYQKGSRPIFITSSTFRRWVLPEEARELVLQCCLEEDGVSADLHAVVIMPDHVHLLLTPLLGKDLWAFPLAEIMRRIKGRSARAINLRLAREGPVWQAESFDHVLRSKDSLAEKVDYICQNPVRAGLVASGDDYRWLWRGRIPVI